MPQDTSRGGRNSIKKGDVLTEKVMPKRDEVPTMPPSKKSRSCEESGEAARTEFQSRRDKWRSYHEQSPDTPTIEKFKGRPRGARASFWENKIESLGDVREVTSSSNRLQEMKEEIRRSRKPWGTSADFTTEVDETKEETSTIEAVKCRPRGARASFWENKICSMETETETVDHRREIAHRQKMEEEILRFRRPWKEVMTAAGVTDEDAQASGQQLSEPSDSSSEEEKAISDSSSSDEEYYAWIDEQKRLAKLKKELSDGEMDETIATELENLDISDFPKMPDDNKKSHRDQALSDDSSDEEYYAWIEEQKRQAKLKKELSDGEMDETIATELENLDISDFPKKPDDNKKSHRDQALSDDSSDEEYYAWIEEQKRQAKLKKELSDGEMDETIATELENLDISDFPKKPDDGRKSYQFDAEKGNNSQSCTRVTKKKPAPQKSEDVAEHKTRVQIYNVTEKKSAPQRSADTKEQETPFEVLEAKEKQAAAEEYQEIAKEKAPTEVSQATEKSVAKQAAEIVEQKTFAEVPHALEEKSAPKPIADIREQKSLAEGPKNTEQSIPKQSVDTDQQEIPCDVPQATEKKLTLGQSENEVEQKIPAEVTEVTAKMSASEQSAEMAEQDFPIEVSKATEKSQPEYTKLPENRIQDKVPQSTEKKVAPLQSAETAEQKSPIEVPQATDKSVPEKSAHKTEENTPVDIPQSIEKIHASVQYAEIAGSKTLAEVIAEVSQATENNPVPLQSSKTAEAKTPAELPEAVHKNSIPEHFGESTEQKSQIKVHIATEKQSAPEQYAVMESTATVPCATKSESCPEKIVYAVNEKITVETPSDAERICSMESVDAVEEPSPVVSDSKVWLMKATAKVPSATERKSGPKKYGNALKQKTAMKDPSVTQRKPDSVNAGEKSTPAEVYNLKERESSILKLSDAPSFKESMLILKQSTYENTHEPACEAFSVIENKIVQQKSTYLFQRMTALEVPTKDFPLPKSDSVEINIDGTKANGSSSKGDENIAEPVNSAYEENRAHGHRAEKFTPEDCDNVELDISIAQSDAINSKSEHTASVEIDTGDLKAGRLRCIIQEEIQKEVITHSESIGQDSYTQPDEDVEVYYDAVSAIEGKDTHNEEKVELEEKYLAILAKMQHQENFQNEDETGVSRWKGLLKKVGLAAIGTSCAVGGLYLLFTQADDDTVKWLWNTASKFLPFVEPIPEPEPEKSFLMKMLDYFIPSPPPQEPERYFLLELFDNLPSLPFFR